MRERSTQKHIQSSKYLGFIYVLLFSLFWAMNVVLAGYTFSQGANVYTYGYQTLITSTICFCLYIYINRRNQKFHLQTRHIPYLVLFGILANGIGNYFGLQGIKASALNYGFLIKTTVVFVIAFELIFLKYSLNLKKLYFATLLLFGAYLISTNGENLTPTLGDINTIVAALCFSLVSVFSKIFVQNNAPEYLSLFRSFGGAIVLFLIATMTQHDLIAIRYLPYSILGGILVFLLFYFLYKALEITTPSYISMIGMSFSIFTAILAYIFLDQTLDYVQLIGAFFILLAVILIEKFGQNIKSK